MQQFTVSPDTTKAELYLYGERLLQEVCQVNSICLPTVRLQELRRYRVKGCYIRTRQRICIDLKACSSPVRIPGYRWSYPGWKSDLTPLGVMAHELGHHFWNMRRISRTDWADHRDIDGPVSSYEPTSEEAFAETFKLFCTNPDLLRLGRPSRYQFLRKHADPVVTMTWNDVLANAHPRILEIANRWTS